MGTSAHCTNQKYYSKCSVSAQTHSLGNARCNKEPKNSGGGGGGGGEGGGGEKKWRGCCSALPSRKVCHRNSEGMHLISEE